MPCSACGSSVMSANNVGQMVQRNYRVAEPVGPCDYTNQILNAQLEKLNWFKDKGLHVKYGYKPALINKYLGIVLTSINSNHKCTYKEILDQITTLVAFITSIQ
jgi:hypothetical protein